VLLPLRSVPDTFHEKAIDTIRADYRWKHKGEGRGISLGDFERLVNRTYRSFMYPLAKTKGYGKQPAFSTSKHDAECGCGGIKFDLIGTGSERLCCGDPSWWRPLHRKAIAAKKPKGAKAVPESRAAKKELYLPPSTKVLKSDYGRTPKGVVALTNGNGQWCTAPNEDGAFDPADLDLAGLPLVQWGGGNGQYPCVGTKALAPIEDAREKFAAKLNAQIGGAVEKFRRSLEHARREVSSQVAARCTHCRTC
jgi:hypothetical protein